MSLSGMSSADVEICSYANGISGRMSSEIYNLISLHSTPQAEYACRAQRHYHGHKAMAAKKLTQALWTDGAAGTCVVIARDAGVIEVVYLGTGTFHPSEKLRGAVFGSGITLNSLKHLLARRRQLNQEVQEIARRARQSKTVGSFLRRCRDARVLD